MDHCLKICSFLTKQHSATLIDELNEARRNTNEWLRSVVLAIGAAATVSSMFSALALDSSMSVMVLYMLYCVGRRERV